MGLYHTAEDSHGFRFRCSQALVDCLGDLIDWGLLTEFLDVRILYNAMELHPLGNLPIHPEYRRNLSFCERQELKHQVIPLFCTMTHPCLLHKNEAGQENCFQG